MMGVNPEWMLPVEAHNKILDRSLYTRHLMFLIEHWDSSAKSKYPSIVELVVYSNGNIALDRVDDWWDDSEAFLPRCWEAT